MSGIIIEEDLFVKHSIVDNSTTEGQKVHDFLMSRAKKLAGKYIDFEEAPVTFLFADKEVPNAFYSALQSHGDYPSRDRDRDIIYTKNPLNTHLVCVTNGLIGMVDNIDQLDWVLSHELVHMILNGHGSTKNSKGEETLADLNAIDLVYAAGSDPKQALVMLDKIHKYAEEAKARNDQERGDPFRLERKGLEWSSILDVHMSYPNRRSAIEASLTRLSHLIDDRKPSAIDKSIFDVDYSDPLDDFLNSKNYQNKKPMGQLRLLIDAVEHLSEDTDPSNYFPDENISRFDRGPLRFDIEERLMYGHEKTIFNGKIVEKKYQQKIASMAQDLIYQAGDTNDLIIYLQNQAYGHIKENGYPKPNDLNYLDASGIIYSYFYMLLVGQIPSQRVYDDEEKPETDKIQMVADINDVKDRIKSAKEPIDVVTAYAELNAIYGTLVEIRSTSYGRYSHDSKLDNLTLNNDRRHFHSDKTREARTVYDSSTVKAGKPAPWNNLTEIAKHDEITEKCVISLLQADGITDYRLTHDIPYVKIGHKSCHKIDDEGVISKESVPDYEIEFALKREEVLKAYAYIKDYFDNEEQYIQQTCEDTLGVEDRHFKQFEETSEVFNRRSIADNRLYHLISVFNSLPDRDLQERTWKHSNVFSLISDRYQAQNKIPGTNKKGEQKISEDLFKFDNPIFQEHFGEDFKQSLIAKKEVYQQRLFETTFNVAKKLPAMWLAARDRLQHLNEKDDSLDDRIDGLLEGKRRRKLLKKRKEVRNELSFYRGKEDLLKTVTLNYYCSVLEKSNSWYHFSRLTPEQKNQMAEHVIRDEDRIFRQVFGDSNYQNFCDYLDILTQQIERDAEGQHDLTEMMQVVADNYGYKTAKTRDELENIKGSAFTDETRYTAWLSAFDLSRYLKKSSEFSIKKLSSILKHIETHHPDNFGRGDSAPEAKRYNAYKKFITQDSFMESIAKAVNRKANYGGFDIDKNIDAVVSLIRIKNQMLPFIKEKKKETHWRDDFYDDLDKTWKDKIINRAKAGLVKLKDVFKKVVGIKQPKPLKSLEKEIVIRNKKFLNLIEKNIRGLLRKALHQTLQIKDPLQKIRGLYDLYHGEEESFFSDDDKKKADYLYRLTRKEKIFEKISETAKDENFWPKDTFEHVQAYVFAKKTFIDDIELENSLLNTIFDKVETLPSGKKKNECLHVLLDKTLRASYPETRERLFNIYAQDLFGKIGLDDGSDKYQNRLAIYIKAIEGGERKEWDVGEERGRRSDLLSNDMSSADKYVLLRNVSDVILSQEKTSMMMKDSCQVSLNSKDLARSYLYGVGVDTLTSEMDRDPKTAKRFIQFLNSKGENQDCEDISAFIENSVKERHQDQYEKGRLDGILKETKPVNCQVLYDNFWSAPLEARAVIIARMLKSAVAEQDGEVKDNQQSWERVFDVVMDNLIAPDDTSTEAQYSRETMHSYIKAKSDYERELILSAMMVANRNLGEDTGNIGKGLRFFLENSGPAEIKAGQAGGSHPNTPKKIGAELQELKNNANTPARWTVYDWIKDENIPEEYWKDQHLGQIRAASYYATIELGDDEILRLLVPEAREKAKKGFRVLGDTIEDLKEKDAVSDLDFGELTTSVQQMITQASKMSDIETDHEIGAQQCADVKEICDGVTITSGTQTFGVKVMDWKVKGKNWIVMQRAKGPVFNELPNTTLQEHAYKKDFAKGYITFQIGNILSGGKFDHDTHGANLCVDAETNTAGLFDTGAMALNAPTHDEQRLLGHVLYDAIKSTLSGEKSFTVFSRSISDKIDALHEQGTNTKYLVEVKKEILALGDFFKVLDQSDVKEIMPDLNILDDIAEPIREGIFERMSKAEQAQLKMLSAAMAFKNNNSGIVIDRSNTAISQSNPVVSVDVEPTVKDKAAWLNQTLAGAKDQKGKSNPTALVRLCA